MEESVLNQILTRRRGFYQPVLFDNLSEIFSVTFTNCHSAAWAQISEILLRVLFLPTLSATNTWVFNMSCLPSLFSYKSWIGATDFSLWGDVTVVDVVATHAGQQKDYNPELTASDSEDGHWTDLRLVTRSTGIKRKSDLSSCSVCFRLYSRDGQEFGKGHPPSALAM